MTRVLVYGEALVDFLPDRRGPLGVVESFTKTIGGAPANAAVGLARLGCDVGLLGKVGDDPFGAFLREALRAEGVDVSGVVQTREAKTGITFISLDEHGDRSFLFYREPSADMTMRRADVSDAVIREATALIAGSNLLTTPALREATYHALDVAREAGRFVLVDPNIRLHMWPDRETAREHVGRELRYADIIKLNEEELAFVADGRDLETVWEDLRSSALALVLTRAADGAEVITDDLRVAVDAPAVDVVDTTGAGDGFVAGLLTGIMRLSKASEANELRAAVRSFSEDDWRRILQLGCHVGTRVCKGLGATPALPTADAVPWDTLGL